MQLKLPVSSHAITISSYRSLVYGFSLHASAKPMT